MPISYFSLHVVCLGQTHFLSFHIFLGDKSVIQMHVLFHFKDKCKFNILKINNSLEEKVGHWNQIQLPLYVLP